MKTTLDHLPEDKQDQLRRATDIIVNAVEPAMLILFGSYARGNWVEDFSDPRFYYQSDFDLLALFKNEPLARKVERKPSLRKKLDREIRTPVSLIGEGIHYMNVQLRKGHFFYADIVREGVLLHDNGKFELAEPTDTINLEPSERKCLAEQDFEYWLNNGLGFIRDFGHAMSHDDYNKSAFYLHQAAECFYSTILLVYLCYKPKSHDLEKLSALAASVEPEVLTVFPRGAVEDRACFELLRQAYVSARYEPGYTVTRPQLAWLAERIRLLEHLTKRLCREKIDSFAPK